MIQNINADEMTLGYIAVKEPALIPLFNSADLDYCCKGKRSLSVACAEAGIETQAFVDEMTQIIADANREMSLPIDMIALPDHIVEKHHEYIRANAPVIRQLAETVSEKHGLRDPRLLQVLEVFSALSDELASHMHKEEIILFPMIKAAFKNKEDSTSNNELRGPIQVMLQEHDSAGEAIAKLSELTDGFEVPKAACTKHTILINMLSDYAKDLKEHIHIENNILFPAAESL